jgi:ribosome biogenesis GTPase / thiamine phosphate phosphatase
MARGWRQLLEEPRKGKVTSQFEKMRKEKRSVRGRVTDDWIINTAFEGESAASLYSSAAFHVFLAEKKYFKGRVIEVHKRHIFVAEESQLGHPDTGLLWLCSVAKRHFQRAHKERNFVVVGDAVLFEAAGETQFDASGEPINTDLPRGVIQHSFSRHSKIGRKDPSNPEWEHVMLANIDLICITASVLHPEVRWGLIDRFLVQAEEQEVPVVIVLNKVDLLNDAKLASTEFIAKFNERVGIYRGIGYEVIEVCALKPKKTPEAVARLRELFKGKIVGFCGHSGVGKSSILNLMKPEFEQVVDDNPEIFYKGRHTTTYNSLLTLGIGAYAIDTPGIRSLPLDTWDPITLTQCFPEMRGLRCKFKECSHVSEPGCNVMKAVEEGLVSRVRYRSYLGLYKGMSLREGEGDASDAPMIADIKARQQARDAFLEGTDSENSELRDQYKRTENIMDVLHTQEESARAAAQKSENQLPEKSSGSLSRRLAFLKKRSSEPEGGV